jgi:hypothetical protein
MAVAHADGREMEMDMYTVWNARNAPNVNSFPETLNPKMPLFPFFILNAISLMHH